MLVLEQAESAWLLTFHVSRGARRNFLSADLRRIQSLHHLLPETDYFRQADHSAMHTEAHRAIPPSILKRTVLFRHAYWSTPCYSAMHTEARRATPPCTLKHAVLFRHAYWSAPCYSATHTEVYVEYNAARILKHTVLFCNPYWRV